MNVNIADMNAINSNGAHEKNSKISNINIKRKRVNKGN